VIHAYPANFSDKLIADSEKFGDLSVGSVSAVYLSLAAQFPPVSVYREFVRRKHISSLCRFALSAIYA
jgi:hypothetical protein